MGQDQRSKYNILVALVAAIGSFTYGYTASIMGGTLGRPEFYVYMELTLTGPGSGHTNSLIAAWNLLLYAGGLVGVCFYPELSRRFGRRLPLAMGGVVNAFGGALSAGEINPGMLCAGRFFAGFGLGLILPGTPLYQAEIAPPHSRGLVVGLHASLLGTGMTFAQWMGVAFFHVGGQASWRTPLALSCVWPTLLAVAVWFLPESPRWLYLNGRAEQAQEILIKLHHTRADVGHTFARNEFRLMKAQIDLEAEETQHLSRIWTNRHLLKRFVVGWVAMSGTQASGSIIILTYSAVIYGTLGFSPFMIGIMTGIWTIVLAIGNFIGGVLSDYLGRKLQMLIGLCGCLVSLILGATLTALYAATDNKAGNRAAAFSFFLFVVFYSAGIEAGAFIYTSEIFPSAWRASGVAFSMMAVFFWSVLFTGVASPAFANIGWKFFTVFISLTAVMAIIVALFFPETKGYSLEQVSAAFGDQAVGVRDGVVETKDFDVAFDELNKETTLGPASEQVERADKV